MKYSTKKNLAQSLVGPRKISLPSLKITSSTTRSVPLKADLKGSWTSSDQHSKLTPTTSIEPKDPLDVTILSPMVIVKPSKLFSSAAHSNQRTEKSKGGDPMGFSRDNFNLGDSKEENQDSRKGDPYIIAISPPMNDSNFNNDAEYSYLRLLEPSKLSQESPRNKMEADNMNLKMMKFKPVDATIDEKAEISKRSNAEDDSSNLKNGVSRNGEGSSTLNKHSQYLLGNSIDKDKTDSLEFIKVNDTRLPSNSKKKSTAYPDDSMRILKGQNNSLNEGSNDENVSKSRKSITKRSKFGHDSYSNTHHSHRSKILEDNQYEQDRKETILNPIIDHSALGDSNNSGDFGEERARKPTISSHFNHSEYLEKELYRSSFDRNSHRRIPGMNSQTPVHKLELEVKQVQKARPDWLSDNSSIHNFADFSSED